MLEVIEVGLHGSNFCGGVMCDKAVLGAIGEATQAEEEAQSKGRSKLVERSEVEECIL